MAIRVFSLSVMSCPATWKRWKLSTEPQFGRFFAIIAVAFWRLYIRISCLHFEDGMRYGIAFEDRHRLTSSEKIWQDLCRYEKMKQSFPTSSSNKKLDMQNPDGIGNFKFITISTYVHIISPAFRPEWCLHHSLRPIREYLCEDFIGNSREMPNWKSYPQEDCTTIHTYTSKTAEFWVPHVQWKTNSRP